MRSHLHIERNARGFAVNVESTLELEEIPVFCDHLDLGTLLTVLCDDLIDENDLIELHSQIILISERESQRLTFSLQEKMKSS